MPAPLPEPRRGSVRERRGRGPRGPAFLPGPLTPAGVPADRSRRERFDRIVGSVAAELEQRWGEHLGGAQFAVEETPWLPDDWASDVVPLAALAPATPTTPTRIVLFRRPLEHRADGPVDLAALVHAVLVEQIAELLGVPVEEIDPRYGDD
ncbi:metallopeptidase family protein [Nocardioides massiliensis]|uniref:Zinicin-like metallopeptidase n=1 Tax=Nocardioides massiliensis TaxID=1325935 RepID=A0ABT9NUT2_9ACTN|nr:metallopeptidase family protein [Nocardioides massiliensis]MDP9824186.1 hypothetical protein [Nocardioides massiliensis]